MEKSLVNGKELMLKASELPLQLSHKECIDKTDLPNLEYLQHFLKTKKNVSVSYSILNNPCILTPLVYRTISFGVYFTERFHDEHNILDHR